MASQKAADSECSKPREGKRNAPSAAAAPARDERCRIERKGAHVGSGVHEADPPRALVAMDGVAPVRVAARRGGQGRGDAGADQQVGGSLRLTAPGEIQDDGARPRSDRYV